MRKKFSRQVLFELRNHVPIRALIENELNLAHHRTQGLFRFQCPDCHGFHTSVKYDKNLARCFDCRKNYNPIDMVMAVMKTQFYDSASFLLPILERTKACQKPLTTRPLRVPGHETVEVREQTGPVKLGDILHKARTIEPRKQDHPCPQCNVMEQQIQRLEDSMGKLEKRVEQIYRFTITGMTEKRKQ